VGDGVTQAPLEHTCSVRVQSAHAAPASPQRTSSMPVRQVPEGSQQPVVQVLASQLLPEHAGTSAKGIAAAVSSNQSSGRRMPRP
jgi:hypothetical protein